MNDIYTSKILDLLADVNDEIKSGEVSKLEIFSFTFVIIIASYIFFGTPVLLALMEGSPVTNPGLLYDPVVDLYFYFKYW